jgi:hypothetical protein
MCKKLVPLVSIVIVLLVTSATYGVVIGNWENDMDGWEICSLTPPGNPILSFSTTGVTLDANSLRMEVPESGWRFALILKLQNIGMTEEFFRHNIFSIDVTRLASEWTGADGYTELQLIVNGDGGVWDGYGAAGNWSATDGDNTQTVSWDYSDSIEKFDPDNVGYLEFIIITNYSNEYATGGIYYLDNARLLGSGNVRAHNPEPVNEATDVQRDPTLVWRRGMYSSTHNIYLGTSFSDVNNATPTLHPNVTFIQSDVNNFTPGNLQFDTTYYWRVDEVNDTDIWKGIVWNFTVGRFLVVDDMEAYNGLNPEVEGSNRIFLTWIDGYEVTDNGALVGHDDPPFVEQTVVHGGDQSMPFNYDNDMKYSEAKMTLSRQRDWTEEQMKALSLWFYGDPENSPEQMYVAVANANGQPVIVNHPDAAQIQIADWQQWVISMDRFSNDGVVLRDVNSIAIGFGDKNNLQAGGTGKVLFDDIRLYPSQCILSERSASFARLDFMPPGDPAGDCVIDYQELEIMARDWLIMDEVVPTSPPGTDGLVAFYPFDTGVGTTVPDASVNIHNGTINGGLSLVSPGVMNSSYAMNFDGSAGSRISIGTWNPAAGTGQMTLALWIRWAGPRDPHGGQPQGLICKRDGWSSSGLMFMFEMDTPDTADTRGSFALRQHSSGNTDIYTEAHIMDQFIGKWAHVAATFDGTTGRLYLNGSEVASGPFSFANKTDAGMTIGNNNSDSWPGCPGVFNGDMDDIRIYNLALSAAQIAYLADTTPDDGELHSVLSQVELFEAGMQSTLVVNFADFAVLADRWLDQELWP